MLYLCYFLCLSMQVYEVHEFQEAPILLRRMPHIHETVKCNTKVSRVQKKYISGSSQPEWIFSAILFCNELDVENTENPPVSIHHKIDVITGKSSERSTD